MKRIFQLLFAFSLIISSAAAPVFAGATDPLYVNMTTNDSHRANMAISFSKNQFERGHPLTIFLNDEGGIGRLQGQCRSVSRASENAGRAHGRGAVVLICPMCMKQYGVKEADILPGRQGRQPRIDR